MPFEEPLIKVAADRKREVPLVPERLLCKMRQAREAFASKLKGVERSFVKLKELADSTESTLSDIDESWPIVCSFIRGLESTVGNQVFGEVLQPHLPTKEKEVAISTALRSEFWDHPPTHLTTHPPSHPSTAKPQ